MTGFWGDKRYNSLDYFLKNKFGEKVYKVSLDAGFTCPNRDGKISREGCIFCSEQGSGDFIVKEENLTSQFNKGVQLIRKKSACNKFIAYFQAYTNTYGSLAELRRKYFELIELEEVCGIAVATRPDCLDDDILGLLGEINRKKYLWVELGFQTSNEKTAELINRGYLNSVYSKAVAGLKKHKIDTVAHVIFGLPGESREDMMKTVDFVVASEVWGIKFHLLHLIRGTKLEKLYNEGRLKFLEKNEYVELIIDSIERIPGDMVVHRITGDGPRNLLVGPMWSTNKKDVLNNINKRFLERNTWQGRLFGNCYKMED